MNSFRTSNRTTRSALMLLCCALLGLTSLQVHAQGSIFGGPSPLSPEEAFKPSIEMVDDGNVLVHFEIADEYYLYEKRFSFESTNPAVVVGKPSFSEALVFEDEYFGKSNIFRDSASITVPVTAKTATELELNVGYQGCADLGLCYPPSTTLLKVKVPASNNQIASKTSASSSNVLSGGTLAEKQNSAIAPLPSASGSILSNAASENKLDLAQADTIKPIDKQSIFGGTDTTKLLGPQEAFVPKIVSAGDNEIALRWLIQPGYYLYRDKISFTLLDAGNASVAEFDIDRGQIQNDAYFGDVEILREVPNAKVKLANAQNLSNATLEIRSQGCADIGVCFPPETTTLAVSFVNTGNAAASTTSNGDSAGASSGNSVVASNAAATAATTTAATGVVAATSANAQVSTAATSTTTSSTKPPETEQNKLKRLLEGGHLGVIALTFYLAGILLAFTACMYPMIPILSSLIVGQGNNIGATRAFFLSLVYVMSMASVFAVVGVAVGLSGYNVQPLFQNPWVLSAFAALFVVLALSMFGLFQLQMPNSIQAKVSEISNKQKSGSVTGVAMMGVLSALIVGPCVTPPLVAALAYIANTGDARIGGIALFAIGIGMGTPLLFIGTSLGKFMPKAGGWMDASQRIFGIILLAVAIYMLSRFLPANIIMLLSGILAIFSGVFFGGMDGLDKSSNGAARLGKSVGLVAMVYGVVLMVGALAGNSSLLSPLKGIAGTQSAQSTGASDNSHVSFQRVKSVDDLNAVLAQASAENRPVMLDFYADWCISCKEMEAYTFPDKEVQAQLENTLLIQADVTRNDADDKALLKRFELFGPPAIILYDENGTELTDGRIVGFMKANKFAAHLQAYLN